MPGPFAPPQPSVAPTVSATRSRFGAAYLRGGAEMAEARSLQQLGGLMIGMAGERIPLVGRIVAVADAFDSLTHERPYKPALAWEEAVGIIEADAGSHFDPGVVGAFLEVVESGRLTEIWRNDAEAFQVPSDLEEETPPWLREETGT